MTKQDKINELENSIKMYEKDIEDSNSEEFKEELKKEIELKHEFMKELESLTDEEFDYYMRFKLPLNKELIQREIENNNRRRHEMVDIPESHVHIGLSKEDIAYLNNAVLDERTTEKNYDSKVVDSDSADYLERKFTEGELKCLNTAKELLLKPSKEKTEREKNEIAENNEDKRLGVEKYKLKKLRYINTLDDLKDIYSIDEPFMNFYYLCTLPEYYDISENEVMTFYVDRNKKEISINVRESVGKYQVAKLLARLDRTFFEKLFGLKKIKGEQIILRHLSSCGDIEYTEVFSNVQLENFKDSQLCYQDEGFRTIFITFKYEVEKIYKKFDLCESYGLLNGKEVDETKIENAYAHYTDEQLNEVIEQSEIETNVNLAKQELEKRIERKKKLQEQVNTWNEISKRAENYAKPVTQVSILDELPKISEMEEGITYIEKGTGSSGKIHRIKKDNDGATKEEDNKEDIQK